MEATGKTAGSNRLFALYTQKNLFKILLNQTEIRLYLPFSDRFGTSNGRLFGSKSIGI